MSDWPLRVIVALAILVALAGFARAVLPWTLHVDMRRELERHRNVSLGIGYSGFLVGVLHIAGSALGHTSGAQIAGASLALGLGAASIALFAALGHVGLRLLATVDLRAGMRANNAGAGVVAAGAYIGLGQVMAGAVSADSEGGSWATTMVFLAIGLGAFVAVSRLYRRLTRYDDDAEIARGNLAAALGYAGLLVAVGMIAGHAIEGTFLGYATSLRLTGQALALVALLYVVRQFLVQGILLGGGFRLAGGRLDDEIAVDRNVGAGAVEAAAYVGAAIVALRIGP
ncbi:MAG TPA: DUF350 domain-containing protein [Polyangiaceae bacterium]|nr:DUF350 domain-containing protein [Polyangiaceae bacterium]